MSRPTIVIPAHDEAGVLGRCLDMLTAGAAPDEMRVVVVSNGSTDATVEVARAWASRGPVPVEVVDLPVASKIAALREGFALAQGGPVLVLDADIELSTVVARRVLAAVETEEPVAASAHLRMDASRSSWPVRAFYRVWSRMPYAAGGTVGSGVFALSAAGLERLGEVPDVTNDDAWVLRSFAEHERLVVDGEFVAHAARTVPALVRRRARVAEGNRQLDAAGLAGGPRQGVGDVLGLLRAGRVAPADAAAFLAIGVLTRLAAARRRATGDSSWSQDTTSRSVDSGAGAPSAAPVRAAARPRATGAAALLSPALLVHLAKVARFYSYSHVEPRRRLTAGPGLRMSPTASLRNGERIVLGRDVHVGEGSCLWAGNSAGRIVLGDHALLGPGVFVTASNYRTVAGTPVMDQPKVERDVVIGADVWLGARVVVLPGVTIGDGAIVGAGSVVTRSLPADCIAVGSPARVVGYREGASPAAGEPR